MNQAGASGDTTAMRRLSANCDQCDLIAAMIDRTYRAGGRIEGDGWEITSAHVASSASGDKTTFVDVHAHVHSQTVYRTATSGPETYRGNPDRLMLFSLDRPHRDWSVTAISVLGDE